MTTIEQPRSDAREGAAADATGEAVALDITYDPISLKVRDLSSKHAVPPGMVSHSADYMSAGLTWCSAYSSKT